MNINSLISSQSQLQAAVVRQQVGIAVAAKALDASKQQGKAAVQLLETASQIGKAVGKGSKFDAVA